LLRSNFDPQLNDPLFLLIEHLLLLLEEVSVFLALGLDLQEGGAGQGVITRWTLLGRLGLRNLQVSKFGQKSLILGVSEFFHFDFVSQLR